jgi:hypothetical protein
LHLFRDVPDVTEKFRQFHGGFQIRSGMTGEEIGHQKLPFPKFTIHALVCFLEPEEDLFPRFAHETENFRRNVFRGYFQLAAYVMGAELREKRFVGIGHNIIVANPRADEDLFYSRKCAKGAEQIKIVSMLNEKIRTWRRRKASPFAAGARGLRQTARRISEISRGPPHVVNISLEFPVRDELFRFFEEGGMASFLNDRPLMGGKGTKSAFAIAPSMSD